MNDLSGLDWSQPQPQDVKKPPLNSASAFAALRPTPPISGRSTPLNGGRSNSSSKPTTPGNDSFSNLVSFSTSSVSTKNLSLQEQQKRLLEQKSLQEANKKKELHSHYTGGDDSFWNNLGSGRNTPAPGPRAQVDAVNGSSAPKIHSTKVLDKQNDDPFGALGLAPSISNRSSLAGGQSKPISNPIEPPMNVGKLSPSSKQSGNYFPGPVMDDDDDIFGLGQMPPSRTLPSAAPVKSNDFDDEDDLLGLLGKPVSQSKKAPTSPKPSEPEPESRSIADPRDRAVAELVDMGFPPEKAHQALLQTESQVDVQAAVSWLLNQAHTEAREKTRSTQRSRGSMREDETSSFTAKSERRRNGRSPDESEDLWSRNSRNSSSRRREMPNSSNEKDPAQVAAEIGSNLLKTAGSLWKTGTKKVQQAVQEFNSDSDSSQPRWMKNPAGASETAPPRRTRDDDAIASGRGRRSSTSKNTDTATDEARMLESDSPRPVHRKQARPRPDANFDSSADNSRDHSPAIPSRLREAAPVPPSFLRQQQPQPQPVSKKTLNRQVIDEQASQAYVSSARRRKPPPDPILFASEPNLLETTQQSLSQRPATTRKPPPDPMLFASEPNLLETTTQQSLLQRPATTQPRSTPKSSTPIAVLPKTPPREIPSVSIIALKASNSHREAGTSHFKRGDFSAAHQSYATAISHLPRTHPIVIVLLTNRALTALKIGEPRTAISDSDAAIGIIGSSKGEQETIDFGNGEAQKPMREFYGKALMRKAEALEQIEKWSEAAAMWKEAVEGGHGGATSIQGRIRAEKAANPSKPIPKPPTKKPAATVVSRRSALDDLSGKPATTTKHANSAAAVNRLRAANAAAERADDEKFALADSVHAKLTAWKAGKADNLRALLGSLDTVLWPEAGWKKIGMAELVLPNKVKIQYMKGIAKVHPDKIPTTATTEQRMIAGAVFSTLNEAWDKFKAENGL